MKRRDFSKQLAGVGLGLSLATVARAQTAPVEGQHYVRLQVPAPVTLPSPDKKIEVVEFFWYGCPHCNAFEPQLESWVKRLPPDVTFRQVPVGFMAQHQLHQKVFYALEKMGQLPAMHRKIFAAIHQQKKHLSTESDIKAFLVAEGVDGAKLADDMKSFDVNTKANRAKQLTDAYKIDGVPALGIHGRFYTSGALAGTHERALAVTDYLIQRARQRT